MLGNNQLLDLLIGLFNIWGGDIGNDKTKEKVMQTISLLQSAGAISPQVSVEELTSEMVSRMQAAVDARPDGSSYFEHKEEE